MSETKRGLVQSVSRAADILRCFEGRGELGLSEISRLVGLHKSTAAGIVNTLREERLLEQNEATGKLRLGIELLRLSANIKLDLKAVCAPHLEELLRDTGETVCLAVRDGDAVVYVEKKESPHAMRICTRIGERMPMHCTAVGKAMLAFLDEGDRERFLQTAELTRYTYNTITDRDILRDRLRRIRAAGYATDAEEWEYGLVCVAVPLLGADRRPVGGLSVSGPSIRMTEQILDQSVRALLETAAAVRRAYVGYAGN